MASVLGTFLEGQASRALYAFVGRRKISYAELTSHLKKVFVCHLSQYALGRRLDTQKRSGDTRKQYITYLKFIERLMVGGRSLLETVCNNACPELKSTLLSKVEDANMNYMEGLDKVSDLLIRLNGDGRCVGQSNPGGRGNTPRQTQQQQQRLQTGGNGTSKTHGGHQQGSNQKQNKQQSNQQGSQTRQGQRQNGNAQAYAIEKIATCWNCGEPGHKSAQCSEPMNSPQHGPAYQT